MEVRDRVPQHQHRDIRVEIGFGGESAASCRAGKGLLLPTEDSGLGAAMPASGKIQGVWREGAEKDARADSEEVMRLARCGRSQQAMHVLHKDKVQEGSTRLAVPSAVQHLGLFRPSSRQAIGSFSTSPLLLRHDKAVAQHTAQHSTAQRPKTMRIAQECGRSARAAFATALTRSHSGSNREYSACHPVRLAMACLQWRRDPICFFAGQLSASSFTLLVRFCQSLHIAFTPYLTAYSPVHQSIVALPRNRPKVKLATRAAAAPVRGFQLPQSSSAMTTSTTLSASRPSPSGPTPRRDSCAPRPDFLQ
ncbi:uncharacterized protein BDR25DRAFT_362588 [Lindgomyces ingoldianus]|uniref:Uncharacterized protein n=1 Tax=Lindgomyces ingoldianus TaxID=673940 RepID=A0ACB6Q9F3_9PLEO|nr:uncharacterized protein BDR25DRAFT_362588 [Lindgomyces ingoldianus]KAF2463588.1 hypothetical protein BDR25DRAFT_362588 [Lindgomyces ingoldianus]